ncbi:MAG: hypothetical protein NTY19_47215 [Planctomycetota bacterium]|nr:hypothetical protein [Planctomycetota bacterium]
MCELRENRVSGQPVIDEQVFPTEKLRVTVIWDEWDRLPLEDRTAVILRSYEIAEGRVYRENIALASGLTFPEAYATGMLPFQVFPALREGDPVTREQCRQAMIDEGASTLLDPDRPQLRFSTQEESDAAMRRLIERLPNSAQVWVTTREVGNVENWAQR